jgi:hypothetical protein
MGLQFVWYWKPLFFFFRYPDESSWSFVYSWVCRVGFLEIRKWSDKKLEEGWKNGL